MAFDRLFIRISYLLPRGWIASIRELLIRGGFGPSNYRKFTGYAILFSYVLSLLSVEFVLLLFKDPQYAVLAGFFILLLELIGLYFMLTSAAISRGRKIEEMLPDALRIISSNIRAGMTVENAVWSAARPEFGPLRDEIGKVAADTFAGKPIEVALADMPSRVESKVLERAIGLMVEGLHLGGRMTDLLDEVAAEISASQSLQEQIKTSTTTYAIFIMFASLVAAPLLFSVSTFYSEMNERTLTAYVKPGSGVASTMSSAGLSNIPIGFGNTSVSTISYSDIRLFSVGVLVITAFFAAVLIWQIKEANPRKGLAYSPAFVGLAVIVYVIVLSLLEKAFF